MTAEQIKLSIPAHSKYVSIARLVAGGLATKIGFSSDEIEDIKVAVSEACNNCVQYAYPNKTEMDKVDICFTCEKKQLAIEVSDQGVGFDVNNPPKRDLTDDDIHMGLGLEFIQKLMTSTEIKSAKNQGTVISMIKKIL